LQPDIQDALLALKTTEPLWSVHPQTDETTIKIIEYRREL